MSGVFLIFNDAVIEETYPFLLCWVNCCYGLTITSSIITGVSWNMPSAKWKDSKSRKDRTWRNSSSVTPFFRLRWPSGWVTAVCTVGSSVIYIDLDFITHRHPHNTHTQASTMNEYGLVRRYTDVKGCKLETFEGLNRVAGLQEWKQEQKKKRKRPHATK